jgi:hypothetical protein
MSQRLSSVACELPRQIQQHVLLCGTLGVPSAVTKPGDRAMPRQG